MTTPNPNTFNKSQNSGGSTMPNPNLVGSLGSTKPGQSGGEYFAAGGTYVARINQCKWIKTRAGGEAFIVETEVLQSNTDECPVGRKPSWYQDMNKDMGKPNLAGFLRIALTILAAKEGTVLDPTDDEYWEQTLDYDLLCEVVGEKNILAGIEIGLYAKPIVTKAGKDFTVHEWQIPA